MNNAKVLASKFQELIDKYDSVTCAASDVMFSLNGMYSSLRSMIGKDIRLANIDKIMNSTFNYQERGTGEDPD